MPPDDGGTFGCYLLFFLFSHCWFAMPQLVLQADWQDVWHSPQPPFLALSQRFFVSRVLMGFITLSSGFPYFRSDACAARYKRSEAQLYCITIQSACQYSFCGSRGFLRASIPSAPRAERRRARGRRSPASDCRAHSPKAARHTRGSQANALLSPPISQKFRRPRRMPLDGKSPPKGKDNCQNRLSPYLQPAPRMQTRAICGRHTPCRLTAKTPAHMKHKNPRLPPSFAEQIHDIQHDNQNDDQRIKRQRGVNAPPR